MLGVLGSLVLASASCKSTREGPEWATVLDWEADPDVIEDAELQAGITASGLPWRVLDNESGIEFLLVLPGSYLRGAAPEDPYDRTNERPQHEVVLTRPFYLGLYEVTNAQLRRFLPEHDSGPFPRDSTVSMNGDDYRSSPELCVKVRGSSSMLLLGCLGDLLRFEKREIQVATFAPGRSSP